MRLKSVVFVVFLVLCGGAALPAHAGVLEFFFPSLQTVDPDPSTTLTAPFADPALKKGASQGLPENAVPLDVPHRNTTQVADWLTNVTSEAMTFDKDDSNTAFQNTEKYFSPEGRQDYLSFLNANNIISVLQSNKLYIRGFVQDVPLLLNEGSVDGRYRWLFEVPVMLTYMDKGARDYKGTGNPVNQQVTLTIQVGRTAELDNGRDMVIERWTGKAQDVTKK